MRNIFQKTLNNTNIIFGEIYFSKNEEIINLNNGLDFVTINNKFLLNSNSKIFSLINNNISFKDKKIDKLILNWEVNTKSDKNLLLSFRIKRQNIKNEFDIINSTRINGTSNYLCFGTTLVNVNSEDKFLIQIKNIDKIHPESNLIITSAKLRLEI